MTPTTWPRSTSSETSFNTPSHDWPRQNPLQTPSNTSNSPTTNLAHLDVVGVEYLLEVGTQLLEPLLHQAAEFHGVFRFGDPQLHAVVGRQAELASLPRARFS